MSGRLEIFRAAGFVSYDRLPRGQMGAGVPLGRPDMPVRFYRGSTTGQTRFWMSWASERYLAEEFRARSVHFDAAALYQAMVAPIRQAANWWRAGSRICSDAGVKDLEKEDGDRNIAAIDIVVGYVRCGQEQLPLEASRQVSGEFVADGECCGREAGIA